MNPVPSHLSEKPLTTASTSTAALILPRLCGAWTGGGCRDTLKQIQEACSGAQRREQNRKDFPATSHYRGGKACHKSCLEWVRVLHYFLKYFSRKPLSAIFLWGKGREGRGELGAEARKGAVGELAEPHFRNILSFLLNLSAVPQLHWAPRPSPFYTSEVLASGRFPLPHDP